MTDQVRDQLHFGIASSSLGLNPIHTFETKFQALQKAGFKFCEVDFGSYMTWVRDQRPDLPGSTCPPEWSEANEPDPSDEEIWQALYSLAPDFVRLARRYGVKLVVLQPLNQFDGWPAGTEKAEWVRRKAERWLPLCSKLGVEFLQVGSNDWAQACAHDDKTAEDMRWIAELGVRQDPPVKIAYEPWCFSNLRGEWEECYKTIQQANHPNLGLCLDTAQLALAKSYGWDPFTGQGWDRTSYEAMINRLACLPPEKIFYVELSDVLNPKATKPLYQGSPFDEFGKNDKSGKNERFIWVRCARPVPLVGPNGGMDKRPEGMEEDGARVVETLKTIMSTGWRGYTFFEVFECLKMEPEDEGLPDRYASACKKSSEMILHAVADLK
ncbi:hypothetical protein I309_04068 [Cryptococcus deuterogattii LA55]|nr:hypothetical protein I309_04068 [Cryptococcus deuterogattii LA55]KIR90919.1 hypothetical protein I304_05013 [Cryptococcus deuterogattii CBS 10090]